MFSGLFEEGRLPLAMIIAIPGFNFWAFLASSEPVIPGIVSSVISISTAGELFSSYLFFLA